MEVTSVRYRSFGKTFGLKNGVKIDTHQFCCLGKGDNLILKEKGVAFAKCINGRAVSRQSKVVRMR